MNNAYKGVCPLISYLRVLCKQWLRNFHFPLFQTRSALLPSLPLTSLASDSLPSVTGLWVSIVLLKSYNPGAFKTRCGLYGRPG